MFMFSVANYTNICYNESANYGKYPKFKYKGEFYEKFKIQEKVIIVNGNHYDFYNGARNNHYSECR